MEIEKYRFIGRALSFSVEERVLSFQIGVPTDAPLFSTHLPGYPVFPGALLIETMAQCGGVLQLCLNDFGKLPFLAAVKQAKMRSFVVPGDVLVVTACLQHQGSGFAIAETRIERSAERVADAVISYRYMEFPNQQSRVELQTLCAELGFNFHSMAGAL
jgi:3-hydroxyacyl-[acyl-carrier-protein] dehydratase